MLENSVEIQQDVSNFDHLVLILTAEDILLKVKFSSLNSVYIGSESAVQGGILQEKTFSESIKRLSSR